MAHRKSRKKPGIGKVLIISAGAKIVITGAVVMLMGKTALGAGIIFLGATMILYKLGEQVTARV